MTLASSLGAQRDLASANTVVASFGAAVLPALLALVDPTAVVSLFASFLVAMWVTAWVRVPLSLGLTAFTVAQAMCLLLYALQFTILPDFRGFSGPGAIGTDDHFFYTTGVIDLDGWMWTRRDYHLSTYSFSKVIGYVLEQYYAGFGYNHPTQIVVLNSTGVALVPLFAAALMRDSGAPLASQRLAFVLCLFGPFLLSNGAILLRDGWVAAAAIGSLSAVVNRQWGLLSLLLIIAYFMRLESVLLIVLNLGVLLAVYLNTEYSGGRRVFVFHPRRVILMLTIGVVSLAVISLNLSGIVASTVKLALGRPDFVSGFIAQASAAQGGTSTLLTISQLPFPVRQVGGFLFFLGAPFVAVPLVVMDGVFVPRGLLVNLSAIVMVATLPLFVRAVFSSRIWESPLWAALMIVFVIDTLALAELSLQIRHKTATIPLYYVLVGLGLINQRPAVKRLGLAAGVGALAMNVCITVLNEL